MQKKCFSENLLFLLFSLTLKDKAEIRVKSTPAEVRLNCLARSVLFTGSGERQTEMQMCLKEDTVNKLGKPKKKLFFLWPATKALS